MRGWICPKCDRSHAPHVDSCLCSVPVIGQPGPTERDSDMTKPGKGADGTA